MDIVEVRFKINSAENEEEQLDLIHSLLGAYRMNGQVLGQEFAIFQQNQEYITHLKLPEVDSLEEKYNNKYINRDIEKLTNVGLDRPTVNKLGEDTDATPLCKCSRVNGYILYTNYIFLESPLRCFDCFGTIPLYQIPKTSTEDYYDIINWESNYQSCDRLQMNCTVGERFAMNQMLKLDSELTQQGLEICRKISKTTDRNTYYYLHKVEEGNSISSEKKRLCPSCHKEWLLENDIHRIFDFKCQKCLLLSNISWNVL